MAMGATTYEWILDHEFTGKDPAGWKWPYDIPCWVFTHRGLPVIPDSGIELTSADIAAVHEATWPVNSPTEGCWTRSSFRSRP